MPPKRMTANPVKPARYRPGKVTAGAEDSSSSDSEEGAAGSDAEQKKHIIPPPPKAASAGKIVGSAKLGSLDLDKRRKEAQAKEDARIAREKAERLAAEEGFVTESEGEGEEGADDDEEDSDEEDSGSEEESSEDEAPKRLMLRPKFIPKNQRGADGKGGGGSGLSRAAMEEEARIATEEARKKAEADALVEEQIKKDLAARAAGKKHWEDADDGEGVSDVDTTDGLDPEAEEAAWRLRELKRVKRERDRIAEQEAEIAERERRDGLTQEERDAEDAEKIARQQEEKDARGKMGYLQKYYHKGAFLSDEMAAAGLDKRDLMGVRIADDVRDRSALPEYLQRRDMTKLGRKGGTKYKDMRSEDTGRWGEFREHRPDKLDRFGRYDDVDERFRPDDDRGGGDRGGKGANLVPLGERRPPREDRRERSRDRGNTYRPSRDRDDDDGDRQRRPRSRSRSASPRRRRGSRDDRDWRKRSPSRDRHRHDDDKRRKVDTA